MTTTPESGRSATVARPRLNGERAAVNGRTIAGRYESRIKDLLRWAREDGITVNHESIRQFCNLVDETVEFGEASLTMTDAGDINARWGSLDGDHLAIEFLPERRAEYALVTALPNGRQRWNAGVCPIEDVKPILARARDAGVRSVWQHDGYPTATPC